MPFQVQQLQYNTIQFQVQQLHHRKAARGSKILQLELIFPSSIQVNWQETTNSFNQKQFHKYFLRQINRTITEDEKIILYSPEYLKWGNAMHCNGWWYGRPSCLKLFILSQVKHIKGNVCMSHYHFHWTHPFWSGSGFFFLRPHVREDVTKVPKISQFEETADFLIYVLNMCLFRKLGILIEEMVKTKDGKNTLNNYLIWQVSSWRL